MVRQAIVAALCTQRLAPIPIGIIWRDLCAFVDRAAIAMWLAHAPRFPLEELCNLLATDPDEHIRLCALIALAHLGPDCPAAAIRTALRDPDQLVRQGAEQLAEAQPEPLRSQLLFPSL